MGEGGGRCAGVEMEKVWVGQAGDARVWRWKKYGWGRQEMRGYGDGKGMDGGGRRIAGLEMGKSRVRRWVSWERGCIEVNYG
ncbi:MAG TPA: hypothetical protein VG101_09295 [Puia sp.]|jgi:hypothetical protein|nr:hypothetical protein [Puia sp.]